MSEEFERYQRQILLDGWGVETQVRLKNSAVFVAGIGGLGCPVALNLALAGVGVIRICDSDMVDVTNLNRQFLHRDSHIGTKKTTSARECLNALNPYSCIETIHEKISPENVDELVGDSRVIIDCLDNFHARYALNQCALKNGIPMIHGAVWGMEGRIAVFEPPRTPCISCIFPEPPESSSVPVLGAVTSTTGSMQAIEAIRFLAGHKMALLGRMLIMDFSAMKFQELELPRNPSCPVCGQGS
jgi:adenylyltransferase/sulfurtransferase